MFTLQFIAEIVDSIAWPVTVVALIYLLRRPLGELLRDVSKFRYGDFELDFGREISALEDKAKTAGLVVPAAKTPKRHPPNSDQIISDAQRLAVDFPGPAVGLAWTAVERELIQAVMRLKISADFPPYNSPLRSIVMLGKQGYLDKESQEILDRMRKLRNAAVHPGADLMRISSDEAQEFITLTEGVTAKLKSLG
jgi:hypothetical protein